MLFRTIRFRLTLWYVLLLAATLALFSIAVYFAMRESLYSNLDDSLESRASIVEEIVVDDGQLAAADEQLPGAGEDSEEIVRVFDTSADLVASNVDTNVPWDDQEAVAGALAGETVTQDASLGSEPLRIRTEPMRADGEIIGAVEVALSRGDAEEALTSLLWIMAFAYPAALIAASLGGIFLASRALRPVDELTNRARRITAEDLGQRVAPDDLPDDEVGRLARTFDEMIARLDESFRRQRQFTADASHELRTPLTTIKGQTEVALQRDRDTAGYQDLLRLVNAEVDRMIRLVGSLLTLARADAARIPINREQVNVGQIVGDIVDQLRPAAEERGLVLELSPGPDASISADQDLLLQLLLNLLDNAVKYTPSGGQINIVWAEDGAQLSISITNTGPGIPPEHLPRVFDRFYRVDAARTRGSGAGLGLSISLWIAEVHGGTITADSAPELTTFTVSLPLS